MRVEIELGGSDTCIVRLQGRFATGSDAPYLRGKLDELKASGRRKVVADFGDVPYLDSTGISFVVSCYTAMANAGGQFVLSRVSARVMEVLRLTKLAELISSYPDEPSALAAIGGEAGRAADRPA